MKKIESVENGYRHEVLYKSNMFIGTKYKASVLESKVTYLAMLKIQNREYEDEPDGIYVSMPSGEIKKHIGTTSGSFYTALANVANSMTGNNMGYLNEVDQKFEFITVVNKATYENGVFRIRFANEFRDYLINVHSSFTKIPKKIAMAFKKPWSFPLYQLLKQQCFYPATYTGTRNNVFIFEIGLSELKLDLGAVNANQTDVRAVLMKSKGLEADYDRAVKVAKGSKEARFDRFNEFHERCLAPTVKEINEVSDIYVTYRKISYNRGGKVKAIEFTVYLEGAEKEKPAPNPVTLENGEIKSGLSDADKFMVWHEIMNLTASYQFDFTQVMELAEAADYNVDSVKTAVLILEQQTKTTNTPFGFLITAIREKWKPAKPSKHPSQFGTFMQRDYNFEELENKLLDN